VLPQKEEPLIDSGRERALLEAAIVAPSVHNSQPWQFAVGPRRIELWADASRQMRRSDRFGRSLLISCGAALFNLRVAADHLGFHPRIRLLPDRAEPALVAVVDVDHRHPRAGLLDELYPAIWARRTNRFPFAERAVNPTAVGRMAEAAKMENCLLRVYTESFEVERIVDLLRDAEFEERADPGIATERAQWVGAARTADRLAGIPEGSLGPRPATSRAPFRDLGSSADLERPLAAFERTPTVAVLSTLHDHPVDWVRAGQALQRVLLVATNAGLSSSFMNQPLEQLELRWLVRSPLSGVGQAQMLMRVGYGVSVPPTPRRPLDVVRRTLATDPV
jgi:nitroreductase